MRRLLTGSLLLLGLVGIGRAALPPMGPLPDAISDPELARSDYAEHCGGCHGIQGSAAPAQLPELRGRVGWFLCTPQSRAYLIRLPNIAHSRISDNQQLADLVNFMVFGLGGPSVPTGAKPFTADEVERERKFALSSASLKANAPAMSKSRSNNAAPPAPCACSIPARNPKTLSNSIAP